MNGDAVAGQPAESEKPSQPPPSSSRGLQSLVTQPPPASLREASSKTPLLPAWFFFAADLILLAFTVAILLDSPSPLRPGEMLFCLASTALAALFGVLGVLLSAKGQRREPKKEEESSHIRNGRHHDA